MYCLDTNIFVDFLRGDPVVVQNVSRLFDEGDVFMTSLSLSELFKGAFLSSSSQEVSSVQELYASSEFLSLDFASCQEFGKMYALVKKKGKLVPEVDLMIAALAKVHGLTLVTRDKKHFQGLGVDVEVW